MRKIFLITTVFFASLGFVFSQPCTLTTIDSSFIAPSPDSLPCIERGLPYSNSIQINMPGAFDGLITLDSLVITSITGLPNGITYATNPASNVYYGNTSGCILFSGTTNDTAAGYELYFEGYAVVSSPNSGTHTLSLTQLAQLNGPVPEFQLNVINQSDSCHPEALTGIKNLASNINWSISPNPNNGVFELKLDAGNKTSGEIVVTDISGRVAYSQKLETTGFYQTTFNLSTLSKGLYLLQLRTEEGIASKKISIQ
ncbi:MAG: domain proteinfibronectin type protein [Bacteroidota bacterium]|nr:domain proteinfibronectin type protein [Bacteroidota bacterium]